MNFNNLDEFKEYYQEKFLNNDNIEEQFESNFLGTSDIIHIEVMETENKIILGTILPDSNYGNFFEDNEGMGELILFNRDNYSKEMKKAQKNKKLNYLIDKYEHSNVHYSVASTQKYPDAQFDISHGAGVYYPSEEIQKAYNKMKKEIGETEAFIHFIKDTNAILDNYSSWTNGEIYFYNIQVFNKNGESESEETIGGFLGFEDVQTNLINDMKHYVINEKVDALLHNVYIENNVNATFPFDIEKNGLVSLKFAHVYDTYIVSALYKGENNAMVYKYQNEELKVAKYEPWQAKYNVTTETFLNARFISDIKEVLKNHIQLNNHKSLKM